MKLNSTIESTGNGRINSISPKENSRTISSE